MAAGPEITSTWLEPFLPPGGCFHYKFVNSNLKPALGAAWPAHAASLATSLSISTGIISSPLLSPNAHTSMVAHPPGGFSR